MGWPGPGLKTRQPPRGQFAGRRLYVKSLDAVARKVGLPDRYEVLAVVPFGYPRRSLGRGRKNRRPLAEVASAERYGTPVE